MFKFPWLVDYLLCATPYESCDNHRYVRLLECFDFEKNTNEDCMVKVADKCLSVKAVFRKSSIKNRHALPLDVDIKQCPFLLRNYYLIYCQTAVGPEELKGEILLIVLDCVVLCDKRYALESFVNIDCSRIDNLVKKMDEHIQADPSLLLYPQDLSGIPNLKHLELSVSPFRKPCSTEHHPFTGKVYFHKTEKNGKLLDILLDDILWPCDSEVKNLKVNLELAHFKRHYLGYQKAESAKQVLRDTSTNTIKLTSTKRHVDSGCQTEHSCSRWLEKSKKNIIQKPITESRPKSPEENLGRKRKWPFGDDDLSMKRKNSLEESRAIKRPRREDSHVAIKRPRRDDSHVAIVEGLSNAQSSFATPSVTFRLPVDPLPSPCSLDACLDVVRVEVRKNIRDRVDPVLVRSRSSLQQEVSSVGAPPAVPDAEDRTGKPYPEVSSDAGGPARIEMENNSHGVAVEHTDGMSKVFKKFNFRRINKEGTFDRPTKPEDVLKSIENADGRTERESSPPERAPSRCRDEGGMSGEVEGPALASPTLPVSEKQSSANPLVADAEAPSRDGIRPDCSTSQSALPKGTGDSNSSGLPDRGSNAVLTQAIGDVLGQALMPFRRVPVVSSENRRCLFQMGPILCNLSKEHFEVDEFCTNILKSSLNKRHEKRESILARNASDLLSHSQQPSGSLEDCKERSQGPHVQSSSGSSKSFNSGFSLSVSLPKSLIPPYQIPVPEKSRECPAEEEEEVGLPADSVPEDFLLPRNRVAEDCTPKVLRQLSYLYFKNMFGGASAI